MAVSVVIVSHNSSPLLVECVLAALAAPAVGQVIVSDNDSTDCSVEPLEDLAAGEPRLRVIRNRRNLGFAAGNAVGLDHARGEFVLFLNPDCVLGPDTLASTLAALEADPDAAMAGCLIRNPDGSVEEACCRRLPTPGGLLREALGRGAPALPPPGAPAHVPAISGAFMLVRRAVLDQVGAFDPGYFMHWEDLDLCLRLGRAGHRILFVPGAEVLHYKGRSSQRRALRVEWHKHASLVRYFRKFHFRGWRAPALLPVAAALALRFLLRALGPARLARPAPPAVATPERDGAGEPEVWVFGASSVVGRCLLPRLLAAGHRVRAFCTDPAAAGAADSPRLSWHGIRLGGDPVPPPLGRPATLIHLAPLPLLPAWLEPLARAGLGRVIAFGSTSRFTKTDSGEEGERRLAAELAAAEDALAAACARAGIAWAVFRPTMIYCLGHERNVTLLARFIRRFGFFPLPGTGRGRRQPVHADDLARACLALLDSPAGWNQAYNLSGGEVLSYREMVEAIFRRLGRRPRIVALPRWVWRLAVAGVRLLPAYRGLNMQMIERVDADLCFDHGEAARNFGFAPRAFLP